MLNIVIFFVFVRFPDTHSQCILAFPIHPLLTCSNIIFYFIVVLWLTILCVLCVSALFMLTFSASVTEFKRSVLKQVANHIFSTTCYNSINFPIIWSYNCINIMNSNYIFSIARRLPLYVYFGQHVPAQGHVQEESLIISK